MSQEDVPKNLLQLVEELPDARERKCVRAEMIEELTRKERRLWKSVISGRSKRPISLCCVKSEICTRGAVCRTPARGSNPSRQHLADHLGNDTGHMDRDPIAWSLDLKPTHLRAAIPRRSLPGILW